MSADVLCLRPEADFHEVGVQPPGDLRIRFAAGPDEVPDEDLVTARAVVLASVGPPLDRRGPSGPPASSWSSSPGPGSTGAGRVQRPTGRGGRQRARGQRPRGSRIRTTGHREQLRRLALPDRESRRPVPGGTRAPIPGAMRSLHSATVGVVGLGQVGLAVAGLFRAVSAQVGFRDPAPRDPAAAAALDRAGWTWARCWRAVTWSRCTCHWWPPRGD